MKLGAASCAIRRKPAALQRQRPLALRRHRESQPTRVGVVRATRLSTVGAALRRGVVVRAAVAAAKGAKWTANYFADAVEHVMLLINKLKGNTTD